MKEIKTLSPFKRFCTTLGEIPTSYLESMTYYETLMWLCKYLEEKVQPTLNDTILAVQELQEYVSNYFDSLDVQQQINNKLDEMAESGQLTDIIAQYLQLAGVLAFTNKMSMKQADNIANGSVCKTLGESTYKDGKGALYKIRTIRSSDIVDEENIVSLDISDTLIAELIPYSNNYEIYRELENRTSKKVILITDSYGEQNSDGDINKFFYDTFKENMNLTQNVNFYHAQQSGAGFGNQLFLNKLQSLSSIIEDKNSISDILVCGGWNDSDTSQSYGTDEMFNAGILAFNTYARQNYPNAKITIAHISWGDPNVSHDYSKIFNQLPTSIKRYKDACNRFGWAYLSGTEYILHYYDENYWQSDGNHPNQLGQTLLGNELTRAFVSGSIDVHYLHGASITGSGNVEYVNINQIYSEVYRDTTRLWCAKTNVGIYFKINETITPTMNCDGNHEYEMATIYSLEMIGHDLFVIDNIPVYITGSHDGQASSTYMGFADILVHDSKIYLRPTLFDGGQRQENINVNYIWIPNFNITAPTIYS